MITLEEIPTQVLARFTIEGRPEGKKNTRVVIFPNLLRMRLKDAKGPVRSPAALAAFVLRTRSIGLLGTALAANAFTPATNARPEYQKWARAARKQLLEQWGDRETIDETVSMELHVYLAKRQSGDFTNFLDAPGDVLQEAGVIRNDSLIRSVDGSRLHRDWLRPRVEVALRRYIERD